ncbi:MAG: winged helix-turn-helix domain-containing protein [Pseudomonadota bacterium]
MSLPHDESVQNELLRLLSTAPNGRMHCNDVYAVLAKQFRQLTNDEVTVPYRNSVSHWANRVQFARQHLVEKGLLLHTSMGGGRGYWEISSEGRTALAESDALAKQLMAELDAL